MLSGAPTSHAANGAAHAPWPAIGGEPPTRGPRAVSAATLPTASAPTAPQASCKDQYEASAAVCASTRPQCSVLNRSWGAGFDTPPSEGEGTRVLQEGASSAWVLGLLTWLSASLCVRFVSLLATCSA